MSSVVSFPGLGISFNINPVAFTIFGKDIMWYALIITAGLILAVAFAEWEGRKVGISSDNIFDVAIIATPVAIICARAYYVIWEWDYYSKNPEDIVKIWNGGLAIYGAIIGGIIVAFCYCRAKKISVGKFFDVGCLCLLIGQAIGRWGNFMNMEAYGGPTDLPWRMYLEEIGQSVHPTFLYESLWNLLGFILLFAYRKHKKFKGEVFWMYIGWYGIGRAFIEGLRTDSLYLFDTGIRVSQLLAIATAFVAVVVIMVKRIKMIKEELQ